MTQHHLLLTPLLLGLAFCLAEENQEAPDSVQTEGEAPAFECDTGIPFEADIGSFETGQPLGQLVNLETIDGSVIGQFPPNTPLQLCVDPIELTTLVLTTSGGQKRLHTIVPALYRAAVESGADFAIDISQASTLPSELSNVGINLEDDRSITKISLRNGPLATPLSNAQVFSQNINAGSFVLSNGSFLPSTTTDDNGDIWFANVEALDNQILVEVSSPSCNVNVVNVTAPGAYSSILTGCI